MADEIITLYTQEEPNTPISCGRTEFYDNDLTIYRNYYPAIVDVFLFDKRGQVLLQKRGRTKRRNPGKIHTTIGGHVNWGEKPEFALIHECMEELGAPTFLFTKDIYEKALKKLEPYTQKVALVYEVRMYFRNYLDSPVKSRKRIKDRMWLYFGRYDGPIEIPDGDSAGYEWFDLNVLEMEIQTNPEQFTAGVMLYVEEFGNTMKEFVKKYCGR
jgi:isopentenyldiphosphate isomerase